MSTDLPAIAIRPGDRVLVLLPAGTSHDKGQHLKDQLMARFPDVDWTLLAGATGIAVMPPAADRSAS